VLRLQTFDWNCPQHITPRFTGPAMQALAAPEPHVSIPPTGVPTVSSDIRN
jgi:hypothetical protein